MKQELKEIPIEDISPNPYQPREKFDKEKVEELASSILSNGLINPITVRVWKNGYMIVAGERRWRAHKLAGLKTIQAFVKDYSEDGQWMIESLIENVHREDLQPLEKAKYLARIKKMENIETNKELADKVKINEKIIQALLNILPIEKEMKKVSMLTSDYDTLSKIASIDDKKVRERLLKKGNETENFRQLVRAVRSSTPDVKEALLKDQINTEQAKRISKLDSKSERQQAIKEHSAIKNIEHNIEKHIENKKEKKPNDKQLVQVRNWLVSFKNSVTESRSQLQQTIKILMIATNFLSVMDEKQKEKLEVDLAKFLETIEKSKQLAEKIQGYIE